MVTSKIRAMSMESLIKRLNLETMRKVRVNCSTSKPMKVISGRRGFAIRQKSCSQLSSKTSIFSANGKTMRKKEVLMIKLNLGYFGYIEGYWPRDSTARGQQRERIEMESKRDSPSLHGHVFSRSTQIHTTQKPAQFAWLKFWTKLKKTGSKPTTSSLLGLRRCFTA